MKPWRRSHDRKEEPWYCFEWSTFIDQLSLRKRELQVNENLIPNATSRDLGDTSPSDSTMRRSRLVKPIEPFNKTNSSSARAFRFFRRTFLLLAAEGRGRFVSGLCIDFYFWLCQWDVKSFQFSIPPRWSQNPYCLVTIVVDGRDAWKPSKHIYDYLILSVYLWYLRKTSQKMREIRNVN